MEPEFLQLAQRAVAALEAANSTSWVEIIQTTASVIGLGCIVWGLFQMQKAGQRRDREIDMMSRALERQSEAMTQAFTQQGEVLAELLRRSA